MKFIKQGIGLGDRLHPCWQPVFALDISERDGLRNEVPALDIQITGQGPEPTNGAGNLKHLQLHIQTIAVDDAGRFAYGIPAGCFPDQIRIEPEPGPNEAAG